MTDNSNLEWHDATEMPEFYPDKLIPAEVEDKNLVVTNGSFTAQLKDDDGVENVTFTKVNS